MRPQPPGLAYYQALLAAFGEIVVRKHWVWPQELLRQNVWVRHAGAWYLLTHRTVFGYYLHVFEPGTYQALSHIRGETFLDLGANTGQYSIPLSRNFERVVSIEPNPLAIAVLEANLERNGIRNVEVLREAISEAGPSVSLNPGDLLTTWRLGPGTGEGEPITVTSEPLDKILERERHVTLMKIDIEGEETSVLTRSKMLDKVDCICYAASESEESEIGRYLSDEGFELYRPTGTMASIENQIAVSREALRVSPGLGRVIEATCHRQEW